jgi:DNA-binding NtrC family response regulator
VKSKLNVGTIFELYFPANSKIVNQVEKENHKDIKSKNYHFLVVDDEDYVLNILADIIEFLGFTATKKESGEEAINFFKNNYKRVDYAVIDLKMPKMDGIATSAELKKIDPSVKVIFTSGFDDTFDSKKNLRGSVGFLKKPYSINQISKSIKEIIAK